MTEGRVRKASISDCGIISHKQSPCSSMGSSPFSSLALLAKRKDGIWRFCVDCRGLNDIKVKDKYRLSIVDDLRDEPVFREARSVKR